MGGGFRGERISYAATREGAQTAVLTNRGRSLSDYSTTVTPRVFTREEDAHNHCQIGNLGLALSVMAEWLKRANQKKGES